jgi:hypothetical protein
VRPANGALLVAERDARRRLAIALVLFLIIVAIALGIVGVANGLFYLLIIGIAVLVVALIYGAMLFRRGGNPAHGASRGRSGAPRTKALHALSTSVISTAASRVGCPPLKKAGADGAVQE